MFDELLSLTCMALGVKEKWHQQRKHTNEYFTFCADVIKPGYTHASVNTSKFWLEYATSNIDSGMRLSTQLTDTAEWMRKEKSAASKWKRTKINKCAGLKQSIVKKRNDFDVLMMCNGSRLDSHEWIVAVRIALINANSVIHSIRCSIYVIHTFFMKPTPYTHFRLNFQMVWHVSASAEKNVNEHFIKSVL